VGTPLALTMQNRSRVWVADYLPFGELYSELVFSASNEIRFPGQYHDRETGLYYNYFRYYNPRTGRYIIPDPIGLEGGINLFSYIANNPVNWVDPFGLQNANTWTYGEIRSWAIKSRTDFSSPQGLPDAKESIGSACSQGNPCWSVDGSKATAPEDKAAWNNIVNATGGTVRSGGGSLMCVGSQGCWFVHSCYTCKNGKKVLVSRRTNLTPTGTTTVSGAGGGTLYFYSDPLKGWCTSQDYKCGCQ